MLNNVCFLTFFIFLDFWMILLYTATSFLNFHGFSMRINRPNYFSEIDEQDVLFYGEEGRFRRISLDFWKDVYPNILQAYLSTKQPENDFKDTFVDPSFYPIGPEHALRLCTRVFTDIFPSCFETNYSELPDRPGKLYEKDIEPLKDKKGLVGAIARTWNKIGKYGDYHFLQLLEIVSTFKNGIVKLTDKLPDPLYADFVKEIRAVFYKYADLLNNKEIRKEIDKIVFLKHPNATKKIKSPRGYRIVKAEYARCELIFENVDFGRKEQELFWNILTIPEGFVPMETAFFLNCRFSATYTCPTKVIRPRALFRYCIFEKEFAPAPYIQQSWRFINCTIKNKFNFRKTVLRRGLFFHGCVFESESSFIFDNSRGNRWVPKDYPYNKLYFTDTIFGGDFSIMNTSLSHTEFVLKNVAFFKTFRFDEVRLSDKCTFERISFALGSTPQIIQCKQTFVEMLQLHGYHAELDSLGLLSKNSNKKRAQRFYTSWLHPIEAAEFLSKSISWLAKKRQADRLKKTKTSIPFVGEKKNILYPKTALQAFRSQDWNKLKELCKKYGVGEKEKPKSADISIFDVD